MCKKTTITVGLMLVLAQVGLAANDPSLVGWWRLDDGEGMVATDSSGNGNNGDFVSDPLWVEGVVGTALWLDGVDDYVEIPHNEILNVDNEVTAMAWINAERYNPAGQGWAGIMAKGSPRAYSLYTTSAGVLHFSTAGTGTTSNTTVPLNEWVHVAAKVEGGSHAYFLNGSADGGGGAGISLPGSANSAPVRIGTTDEGLNRVWQGSIDDVRVYNRALSAEEVQVVMAGDYSLTPIALNPLPEDEESDAPFKGTLSWEAGRFAVAHDVYFGASFADVNEATVPDSGGQTDTAFDPGRLDFGQTYYWRVDEVNAAPDSTVFKGAVWSFTVEPISIPIEGITATASSSFGASGPEKTIDGSGLTGDLHGANANDMWISGAIPATLDYAFDKAYKLHELWIWNSNQLIEAFVVFGA